MAKDEELVKGTKEIAERWIAAQNSFIEVIMERIGCTREQAVHALNVMIKLKVVKLDLGVARYTVIHGAYLEPTSLWNAVNFKP